MLGGTSPAGCAWRATSREGSLDTQRPWHAVVWWLERGWGAARTPPHPLSGQHTGLGRKPRERSSTFPHELPPTGGGSPTGSQDPDAGCSIPAGQATKSKEGGCRVGAPRALCVPAVGEALGQEEPLSLVPGEVGRRPPPLPRLLSRPRPAPSTAGSAQATPTHPGLWRGPCCQPPPVAHLPHKYACIQPPAPRPGPPPPGRQASRQAGRQAGGHPHGAGAREGEEKDCQYPGG